MLELNYRRARPELVVDINGIAELGRFERDGDILRVGALTRHARFERPSSNDPLDRLLARITRFVAHPPIRVRGTMVGSLAYAHPAAEWPAVAVALDARLRLVSAEGARSVAAAEFFQGPFATTRRPDEVVVEVALPVLEPTAGTGFAEYRRTEASFAVVAAVAVLDIENGVVRQARIGLAGSADRPLRAHAAERALTGITAHPESLAVAASAAAREARPISEPHCSSEYRRHVIEVIVRRALEQATASAEER
jgi:carbon-monoxide dehydrogenase medium subunit